MSLTILDKIKFIVFSWNNCWCPYCGGEINMMNRICFDCDREAEYSDYIEQIEILFGLNRKQQKEFIGQHRKEYFSD